MDAVRRMKRLRVWVGLLVLVLLPYPASGITPKQEEDLSREFMTIAREHLKIIEDPMVAEVEERKSSESVQTRYAGYGYKSIESLSGEGVRSLGDIKFKDIMKEPAKKPRSKVTIDLRKAIIYKAILERPYT